MARDYIYIGSTPCDEPCEQAGGDMAQMRRECQAYIGQLRRSLGPEVGSARLRVKTEHHDFGSYMEVVCEYDDQDDEGRTYAFACEGAAITEWDDEAHRELGHEWVDKSKSNAV